MRFKPFPPQLWINLLDDVGDVVGERLIEARQSTLPVLFPNMPACTITGCAVFSGHHLERIQWLPRQIEVNQGDTFQLNLELELELGR